MNYNLEDGKPYSSTISDFSALLYLWEYNLLRVQHQTSSEITM